MLAREEMLREEEELVFRATALEVLVALRKMFGEAAAEEEDGVGLVDERGRGLEARASRRPLHIKGEEGSDR